MTDDAISAESKGPLRTWQLFTLSAVAVLAFHLAYEFRPLAFLMVIYLACLFEL